MSRAPTVAEALARPRNGFSGLRLALALAVVVSHAASVVSGSALDEPLARATGFTLGEHAVNGFFAVSGFLVTMSFDRRGLVDYLLARTLRILPGLVAATLLIALALGPAMSTLPVSEYLHDTGTWRFVRGTLTTFKSHAALPGVFPDNPYRSPLGTVWTLKYEVLCYLGVVAAGLLGALRRPSAPALLAAGFAAALLIADATHPDLRKGLETALRLPLIFCVGAALYAGRETARLSALPLVVLALACLLARQTPLYRTLLFVAEGYGAVWLGLSPWLAKRIFDPPADLSYGIYLYGWPIQQSLHALWPAASATLLLLPALALTIPVATLSWYGIERPALRLKARALGRRTLGTIEPAGP
ncbi:acyltransferase family protein [uncultured Methylobacterium sp.]|uniref:acyltransferase family protein n=1 Tax=uncultured Methylobacterium sp. TaxID=157278 RepID=UPI0035C9C5C6